MHEMERIPKLAVSLLMYDIMHRHGSGRRVWNFYSTCGGDPESQLTARRWRMDRVVCTCGAVIRETNEALGRAARCGCVPVKEERTRTHAPDKRSAPPWVHRRGRPTIARARTSAIIATRYSVAQYIHTAVAE